MIHHANWPTATPGRAKALPPIRRSSSKRMPCLRLSKARNYRFKLRQVASQFPYEETFLVVKLNLVVVAKIGILPTVRPNVSGERSVEIFRVIEQLSKRIGEPSVKEFAAIDKLCSSQNILDPLYRQKIVCSRCCNHLIHRLSWHAAERCGVKLRRLQALGNILELFELGLYGSLEPPQIASLPKLDDFSMPIGLSAIGSLHHGNGPGRCPYGRQAGNKSLEVEDPVAPGVPTSATLYRRWLAEENWKNECAEHCGRKYHHHSSTMPHSRAPFTLRLLKRQLRRSASGGIETLELMTDRTVAELERELAKAKERARLAKEQCTSCSGKGWYCDSTYDRSGEDVSCSRCHGTGLPEKRVAEIISDALAPYRKQVGATPPPQTNSLGLAGEGNSDSLAGGRERGGGQTDQLEASRFSLTHSAGGAE